MRIKKLKNTELLVYWFHELMDATYGFFVPSDIDVSFNDIGEYSFPNESNDLSIKAFNWGVHVGVVDYSGRKTFFFNAIRVNGDLYLSFQSNLYDVKEQAAIMQGVWDLLEGLA